MTELFGGRIYPKKENIGKICTFYDGSSEQIMQGVCKFPKLEFQGKKCPCPNGRIDMGCFVLGGSGVSLFELVP